MPHVNPPDKGVNAPLSAIIQYQAQRIRAHFSPIELSDPKVKALLASYHLRPQNIEAAAANGSLPTHKLPGFEAL